MEEGQNFINPDSRTVVVPYMMFVSLIMTEVADKYKQQEHLALGIL